MRDLFARPLLSPVLGGVVVLWTWFSWTAAGQSSDGVLREVFLDIGGGSLADLTSHGSFPNSPALETIQSDFAAPAQFGDSYGQRLRALLASPAMGLYTS